MKLLTVIIAALLSAVAGWGSSDRDSHWEIGAPPGMLIRLEKSTISEFKKAMNWFLPYWVNYDLNLPTHYEHTFHFFFHLLPFHVSWDDIRYSQFDFDVQNTEVDLVELDRRHYMHIDFPAIRHWEISANQHTNTWLLPHNSHAKLFLKYIDLDIQTGLRLDKHGYLDPILYACKIDIGESGVSYDNHLIAELAHQGFRLLIVVIQDSVSFIGEYVFTHTLGPIIDAYTNHYRFGFYWWTPWPGAWDYDLFYLDARNVRQPEIHGGHADFFLAGDLIYGPDEDSRTGCILDDGQLRFENETDRADS
jgi:hypothetical protein